MKFRKINYAEACALVSQNKKVQCQFPSRDTWYVFDGSTPITVSQLLKAQFREVLESKKLEFIAYPNITKTSSRHCFHTCPSNPKGGISIYIRGNDLNYCGAIKVSIEEQ